ncbi:MAG TPA: hypothetical protein V6C50_11695, partial [Crinalium sp.]
MRDEWLGDEGSGSLNQTSTASRLCVSAISSPSVCVYTQKEQGNHWLQQHRGQRPVFACVLGFTATGLLSGISAAGATPKNR